MLVKMTFIKNHISVLAALIIACIAGMLVFILLKNSAPSVPVVVTTKNLAIGTEIANSDLEVRQLPAAAVPDTSYRSIEQVVGQTVVAGPIMHGEIVREEHLNGQGSLLAALTTLAPKNWVAVELPSETGQGMKGLRRGDKVDLYADTATEPQEPLVQNAIIVGIPSTSSDSGEDQGKYYIIAVPEEYAPAVAELTVSNKPMAIALPGGENRGNANKSNGGA